MNERIRELAEQAKCYADENSAHYLQNPHWIETFEEKFAELIVRECAQKLENDGMVEVAMEIKQQFGVGE
jgi:vacuolar-type H+-ATPase subunit D/Vma8